MTYDLFGQATLTKVWGLREDMSWKWIVGCLVRMLGTMFLDLQKARMAIGFFEGKDKFSNI